MATVTWVGATSTSANLAANWSTGSIPAAGDVALYDNNAVNICVWDIPLPGGTTFSVDEIIIESTFSHSLQLTTSARIKGLFLDGSILPISGGTDKLQFYHGASPNFFGSYKTYNERFILIGDNALSTGITFELYGSSSPITKFDDGQHPTVTLATGNFAPDYVAPTGTSGKASFDSFTVASSVIFAPDGDLVDNDRLKVFSFSVFTMSATSINYGLATAEYYATSGGFYIPTEGATGYPSGFVAYHRKIVLKANTAGHKCLIADNTFISVEEFEVGDGVLLKGPTNATSQGADIRSIQSPKIRGTWSFSQISQGIYRSPRNASGPMPKVNGNFHITGKLDVDGLIDPTGLELNPVGSNPGGVAANTLWLNSGDSNKLYHGSSEVGGGGGGITALTGDVTASGSGSVAATIANDSVNDDKLANTTLAKLDGALPKAGGTMTGEIEATTITLNAVPADPATDDKVRIGESGGGNMFQIQTNDGYIQIGPNNTGYAHIQTDRNQFYLSKPVIVDGGGQVFAYNDGLKLGTGSSAASGTTAITIANGSTDITVAGQTESTAFVKTGGASNQFLKADGSVDSTSYISSVPAFQHLRLNLTNNSLPSQSTGTFYYLDLANTSNYTSTGNTASIVVTDATQDYISLAAGGMYMVVVSVEMFTGSGTAAQDFWVQLGNGVADNPSRRRWGTARQKVRATSSASDCAINMQKTVIIDVASTGSDEKLYVIPYLNGATFEIKAYDDNRTNITVTRIGDSTS